MRILLVGSAARWRSSLAGHTLSNVPDLGSAAQALESERFSCMLLGEEFVDVVQPQRPKTIAIRLSGVLRLPGRRRPAEIPASLTTRENLLPVLQLMIRYHRCRSSLRKVRGKPRGLAARQWRQLSDAHPIATLLLDSRGVIVYANQAMARLLHRPPKALPGTLLQQALPEADLLSHWLDQGATHNPLERQAIDLELRLAGRTRHLKVLSRALPGSAAPLRHLSFIDVTDEVDMRRALQIYRTVLETTLRSVTFGVLVSDSAGHIEMANPAAARILGVDLLQLNGQRVEQCLPGTRLDRDETQVVISTSPPRRIEVKLQHVGVEGRLKLILQLQDTRALVKSREELHIVRERERWRVGQDLHDDLGQHLSALSFTAGVLESRLADHSPELQQLAGRVRQQAQASVQKTRALARTLYPADLERSGLRAALQDLATSTEQSYGVRCRVRATRAKLPLPLTLHLYRIAQEAVNNAVNHGQPRSLSIVLTLRADHVSLEIIDDGRGLNSPGEPSPGMGLRSMRLHAELIEGTLEVAQRAEGGVRVCCRAPRALQSVDETQA